MSAANRGRMRLEKRGRALLAAGMALTAAGLVLGFADLARIGLLAVLLPTFCAAVYGVLRPQLMVERRMPERHLQVGEPGSFHLIVVNSAFRSPALHVEERLSPGLGAPDQPGGRASDHRCVVAVPAMSKGQRTQLAMVVRPRHRGRQHIGPTRLTMTDPFGLVSVPFDGPKNAQVIVVPPVHPLDAATTRAGAAGADGPPMPAHLADSQDDVAIRGYEIGDDLRRIHWPVTAHRGELMVRQESRPRSRLTALIVDPRMPLGPDEQCAALDWAVEAMGSVATHLDAIGHELILVTDPLDGARHDETPDGLPRVLTALAVLEAQQSAPAMRAAVQDPLCSAAREAIDRSASVILACSSHDMPASRSLIGLLPPAASGRVFVLDHESFAGSAPGESAQELTQLARYVGWSAVHVSKEATVVESWRVLQAQIPQVRV